MTDVTRTHLQAPHNPSAVQVFIYDQEFGEDVDVQMRVEARKLWYFLTKMLLRGPTVSKWNGKDQLGRLVGSGIYFVTMQADGFSAVQRMLLLK